VGVPAVVLVSGAPGAGKSTLAGPLSQALGLPLLSKDVIKEQLVDTLPAGDPDPLVWSRLVGGVAMELLWVLARQPSSVVLEANVRPRSEVERQHLLSLDRPIVEVHCVCPPELAADRFRRRAFTGRRDPRTHPLTSLSPELLAEFDGPVGLGEVVEVDTTAPVDVAALAARVAALLPSAT
jgi:predicted kinase